MLVHLLFWAAAVAMVLLGLWQLHVAEAHRFPLQNTSYVVQWWLFAACALAFWVRVIRDATRRAQPRARSSGGELVLRSEGPSAGSPGAALLRTRAVTGEAVVYRGYRLPDSSRSVAPGHGDGVHDAYNDQLWLLALADGAAPAVNSPVPDHVETHQALGAPHAGDPAPHPPAE